jgi:hypothetical protein
MSVQVRQLTGALASALGRPEFNDSISGFGSIVVVYSIPASSTLRCHIQAVRFEGIGITMKMSLGR